MKTIYKKIAEAKKEIGKISKDQTNPFYESKYFDINKLLEHVEPILQTHGLMVLQPIENNEVTTIIIDVDDFNEIKSSIQLPDIQDPQKLGSAITYFRRYTLQSLLSLQAEDDDANLTVSKKETKKPDDKAWLNIYTDSSKKEITQEFKDCHAAVNGGGYKVNDIRKKYKVSKEVAKELENEFFFTNDLPFEK